MLVASTQNEFNAFYRRHIQSNTQEGVLFQDFLTRQWESKKTSAKSGHCGRRVEEVGLAPIRVVQQVPVRPE